MIIVLEVLNFSLWTQFQSCSIRIDLVSDCVLLVILLNVVRNFIVIHSCYKPNPERVPVYTFIQKLSLGLTLFVGTVMGLVVGFGRNQWKACCKSSRWLYLQWLILHLIAPFLVFITWKEVKKHRFLLENGSVDIYQESGNLRRASQTSGKFQNNH